MKVKQILRMVSNNLDFLYDVLVSSAINPKIQDFSKIDHPPHDFRRAVAQAEKLEFQWNDKRQVLCYVLSLVNVFVLFIRSLFFEFCKKCQGYEEGACFGFGSFWWFVC